MDTATLQQTVEQMSEEMSLPRGFLEGLLKEDDWSFVIKAHAFLEAVLTNVLIEAFQWPELKSLRADVDSLTKRVEDLEAVPPVELPAITVSGDISWRLGLYGTSLGIEDVETTGYPFFEELEEVYYDDYFYDDYCITCSFEREPRHLSGFFYIRYFLYDKI